MLPKANWIRIRFGWVSSKLKLSRAETVPLMLNYSNFLDLLESKVVLHTANE